MRKHFTDWYLHQPDLFKSRNIWQRWHMLSNWAKVSFFCTWTGSRPDQFLQIFCCWYGVFLGNLESQYVWTLHCSESFWFISFVFLARKFTGLHIQCSIYLQEIQMYWTLFKSSLNLDLSFYCEFVSVFLWGFLISDQQCSVIFRQLCSLSLFVPFDHYPLSSQSRFCWEFFNCLGL